MFVRLSQVFPTQTESLGTEQGSTPTHLFLMLNPILLIDLAAFVGICDLIGMGPSFTLINHQPWR